MTSMASPPPVSASRAATGTTSASVTFAVVIATSTGAWSNVPVAAGSLGVTSTSIVGVTLGLFDDAEGLVQITGSTVHAGEHVVVPAP